MSLSEDYKLALNHLNNGDLEIASKIANNLCINFPINLDYKYLSAFISFTQKNFSEAIEKFKKIIEKNPDYKNINYAIAKSYEGNENYKEAISYFKKEILKNNENETAIIEFCTMLKKLQKNNMVLSYLRDRSDNFFWKNRLQSLELLSIVSAENNLIEESINYFEKYLNDKYINNNFFEMLYNYSEIVNIERDSLIFKKATQIYLNEKLTDKQRSYYHFVLARISKKEFFFQEFSENLNTANALMKKHRRYDFKKDKKLFENVVDSLNVSKSIKLKKISSNFNPIFIIGMPRSGTTLLEQIISINKDIYGAGEIYDFYKFLHPLIINKDFNKITIENIEYVREKYIKKINFFKGHCFFHTDKFPLNFLFINFIIKMFPGCKIINISRIDQAVAWSLYERNFGIKGNFSFSFHDINNYIKEYKKIMLLWNQNFSKHIYNLSYEDLTKNPNSEIRKIINFLGFTWDEKYLSPEKNESPVYTPSKFQVKQKIYSGSSLEWKKFSRYFPDLNIF